jgi:diketogulonate reductase-like aldo/keto reductase
MKRFAHITNGVVVNISEALTDADSHGGIQCPADVAIGWIYSAGVFSVPPVSEAERVAGIKAQLAHLDFKSIRALREGDSVRLVIIEQQILVLRAKL